MGLAHQNSSNFLPHDTVPCRDLLPDIVYTKPLRDWFFLSSYHEAPEPSLPTTLEFELDQNYPR